jgi:hemerythrin superfamily protein
MKCFVQDGRTGGAFCNSQYQQETRMKKATATKAQADQTGTAKDGNDAISMLKADHRKVETIFEQFENAGETDEKRKLVQQVCKELIIHTQLEEELFYPACREKGVEDDMMDEAQVEHDGAKVLIADLLRANPEADFYDAKVKTLSEYIHHHVTEEEKPRSGIFAKAKQAGVDIAGLGQKLQSRKTELMAMSEAMMSNPPQPRSFRLQPQKETSMARNYNDRDRDERGRFTDDDDNRRGYQSRGQDRDERGRFTDDDDRSGRGGYYSRSGGGGPGRDDQGRFTSNDDAYYSRGSSRGGRGQGGWFGDPEGHSRASREGWDERGSSRSRDYEDDRGRGYSSHGGQGRGHGGWYGDAEGHSQASREGWEDRGRYSGRQSSSNRDYDDDNRSSRGGRGHGGWFGDPEGHSEASREGWRNR